MWLKFVFIFDGVRSIMQIVRKESVCLGVHACMRIDRYVLCFFVGEGVCACVRA